MLQCNRPDFDKLKDGVTEGMAHHFMPQPTESCSPQAEDLQFAAQPKLQAEL